MLFITDIDICNGTSIINRTEVILSSPGYPDSDYPANKICERIIHFRDKIPFHVEFLGDFVLHEKRDGCNGDFIEIRNGEDVNSPLIMKECGDVKPEAMTLFGSSVWIKFQSDHISSEKGFALKIAKLAQSEGKSPEICILLFSKEHSVTTTPCF